MKNHLRFLPLVIFFLISLLSCQSQSQKSKKNEIKHHILLRSSWQTVNIGDIAHSPGVLALCEKHLPGVEVRLWASDVGDGVKEMIKKRFPDLEIFRPDDGTGSICTENRPGSERIRQHHPRNLRRADAQGHPGAAGGALDRSPGGYHRENGS